MSINIKDAEEKLGKEKVKEITEKDWKVSELPSAEELSNEKSKSSKARSNPNSRKNLIQYNKKTTEQKEKILKNLKYVENEEDIDPRDYIGDFPKFDNIQKLFPAMEILASRQEQIAFYQYLQMILEDFEADDLTNSDLDDIITLAINRVLEYRLLKVGAKSTIKVLEASTTLEKLRKFSEKIKSGLASRRVDRIDVKNRPNLSIVDLVGQLDENDKRDLEKRLSDLEKKREDYIAPPRDAEGFIIPPDEK